jgi:hypothetical protein
MSVRSVRFPKPLDDRLEAEAARSGIRPAEFIRVAVDQALLERERIARRWDKLLDGSRDGVVTGHVTES